MASKASFTPEEWARVVASPMLTGLAITAAEPSGLWGLLKEAMSGGWALLEAKQDANANPLVKAVADDIANSDTRTAARDWMQSQFKGGQISEYKGRALQELRSIAQILDAKAPEDAPAFKAWLNHVALKAAEAGNEGGFLGFGGVKVSDAEKATMAEILAALAGTGAAPAMPATPAAPVI
ncbi:hypothetical protein GCM10007036_29580 [Alsobacter metallidurans]|uniref:Uncharacterized protein n=1 Tax=Alsobacter metallidurans TaxID=340221 RepID=A0A917MI07_9HYPH|nr:hypothetical protein [Alsobacter metallidurans]GGH23670.1 hypothetical protein GCM10007036_29580 [Alsobacter metallidurans]